MRKVGRSRPGAVLALAAMAVLAAATPAARVCAQETSRYTEPHRPRFHFTPPSMWMNDPNGMVYYGGEYHLFYQYHPDDTVWGPMHWGHAVSRDLVHWEHLPVALAPDTLGYVFSGSAVVDWDDTSGLGDGRLPPLVAVFTYHDPVRAEAGTGDQESQGIAYSTDRGRTWTKYAGNPVLPNVEHRPDFRDPKVFWHESSAKWVMVLAVHDHVELYGSPDLKAWRYLSSFGESWGAHAGTWECPDLFPMRVEGLDEMKWVLIQNLNPGGPQGGSGTQYFVGDFDGEAFTLDPSFAETLRREPAVWLDQGRDDYAGVTWSNIPKEDGRRIFLGWMSNWDYAQEVPTRPWRSAMTLPRTLRLVRTDVGYRVFAAPVRELTSLRAESARIPGMTLDGVVDLTDRIGFPVTTSEIVLEVGKDALRRADFGVELSNARGERYRIGYETSSDRYYSDRTEAGDHAFSEAFADGVHWVPRFAQDGVVRLRLFFDVASVELFADDGATVLTDIFFPNAPFDRIALYAKGGKVRVVGGVVSRLRSIW